MIRLAVILCALMMLSPPGSGAAQPTFANLLRAAQSGDLATVRDLVSRGMDPDTADPAGNTLLMMAAREGRSDVVRYLIGRKAKVDAQNGVGETPIMLASLKGRLDVVKLLQASGAGINHPGWTPLHYCASEGHVEICGFLIRHGATVDAPSPNGTSPLMMATRHGHVEVVKLLLARSANPSMRNDSDGTALSWALKAGHAAIADLLRRAGAKE